MELYRKLVANSATITKGLIGEQDLNKYDGTSTTTFSRPTSTGGTVILDKVGYEVDAYINYGRSFTKSTIDSALSAIGTSTKVTLVLRPGTWVFTADADYSSYTNITFKFAKGAIISHGTYTVNIPNVEAGIYQIFSGTGQETLSGAIKEAYPQWWGATGDGVTDVSTQLTQMFTAVNTRASTYLGKAKVVFSEGTWLCKDIYIIMQGGVIEGSGYNTVIQASGNTTNAIWDINAFLVIKNLRFEGGQASGITATGVRFRPGAGYGSEINHVYFNDCNISVYAQQTDVVRITECSFNSSVLVDKYIYAYKGSTLKIDHNIFQIFSNYAIYLDGGGLNCTDGVIDSNYFEYTGGLTNDVIYSAMRNVSIGNNHFNITPMSAGQRVIYINETFNRTYLNNYQNTGSATAVIKLDTSSAYCSVLEHQNLGSKISDLGTYNIQMTWNTHNQFYIGSGYNVVNVGGLVVIPSASYSKIGLGNSSFGNDSGSTKIVSGYNMLFSAPSGNYSFEAASGATGYAHPVYLGNYALWVASDGKLYIKSSAPTSDKDGTVVGSQSP